ncbi:MAG: UDP-glucose 4-epimerase GalE [Pseudobdellovibrio sp.]
MQTVLVVGGAGYIGSHTVHQLLRKGFQVVVVDNLSTGSRQAIPQNVTFYQVDILNLEQLRPVFAKHQFGCLFHFVGKLSVPESFPKFFEYFDTNVVGTRNLLQMCEEFGVNSMVFSSTSAVYGNVKDKVVTENRILNPENPYGLTKKIAEELIASWAQRLPKFRYRILRYFNVAGAEADLSNGPRNMKSGQLVMNLCQSAIGDKKVQIFGDRYNTPDGTAIRDYIHVVDLASAHIEAYHVLEQNKASGVWNCGYGSGYSVLEVVKAFESVNNIKFDIKIAEPRQGDAAQVVSDNQKIMTESNWKPEFNNIEIICRSNYEWIVNGHL